MDGIKGKRQSIGNIGRTDRLRSCRQQGIMGAGTVCLLREAKPCSQAEAWSLPPPPFPVIPSPKFLPEIYPSAGLGSERLS